MGCESFIRAPSGHFIENFQLVFAHRKQSSVVHLSANPRRVMAAVWQGVISAPVVPYLAYFTNDNQLSLLERYLHSLRQRWENARSLQVSLIKFLPEFKNPIDLLADFGIQESKLDIFDQRQPSG